MVDKDTSGFLEQIRDLIGASEELLALQRLKPFLKANDRDLHREAVVQESRLNDVRKRERGGLMSAGDADVRRAQIRTALLELVDEVERKLDRVLLPVPSQPVDVPVPSSSALEKIFGANHLKSIAWLRTGLIRARSVCRVVGPKGMGTGFLIDGGRMMTNHHVIDSVETAATARVEFGFEESEQGILSPGQRYQLDAGKFFKTNTALDYCVVAVNESSGPVQLAEFGALELETANSPQLGEHVTVIQHPSGGPKQIALTANQVVNHFENLLQYTTDTLPGSSGSPVFNDDWRVVALHHAGGNLLKNANGERLFANEGILVKAILDDLNR